MNKRISISSFCLVSTFYITVLLNLFTVTITGEEAALNKANSSRLEGFWDFITDLLNPPKCPPPLPVPLDPSTLPETFGSCVEDHGNMIGQTHPLVKKSTMEVIRYYGYPAEEHTAITDDGYILTLFRIPKKGAVPILLMHGIAGCSDNWTFNGPENGLAFVLANLGYDVWLGNNRGSSYSLGHVTLSSEVDLEYWDFTWHEMGMYDIPAFINYILDETKKPKLFYVGHSQGTTQFMVGASTYPANSIVNGENVQEAFFLAPAGYNLNADNPLRLLAPIVGNDHEDLGGELFQGRIDEHRKLEMLIGGKGSILGEICTPTATLCAACTNLIFALFGYDAPLTNYTNIPNLVDKFPNIIPYKCIVHYAQDLNSCEFKQFDYGTERNRREYGSDVPPAYQLQNIDVPTFFFYCDMDNLCPPDAVKYTASLYEEKFRKAVIRIDSPFCTHIDFVTAINATALIYDQITNRIKESIKENGL